MLCDASEVVSRRCSAEMKCSCGDACLAYSQGISTALVCCLFDAGVMDGWMDGWIDGWLDNTSLSSLGFRLGPLLTLTLL